LVKWAREHYQIELTVTDSIMGIQQPEATVDKLRAVVANFSPLKLAGK
jgi:chaperone required for assembly of F1-ATPase